MPTSTEVRRFPDSKLDAEAILQTMTDKVIAGYVATVNKSNWTSADHVQYLSVSRKLLGPKIFKMLVNSFCKAHKIPSDTSSLTKNKNYDSFSQMARRFVLVGALPKKVYDEYRASGRSFTAVWNEVYGNSSSVKRILKKDPKKAMDDAHVKVLNRRALEGDAEAVKELEAMNLKPKEEPPSKSWNKADSFDEWKEWKKTARYYIKHEPRKFFNFVLALSNEEVLNSGWGRLAKREIELISTGS